MRLNLNLNTFINSKTVWCISLEPIVFTLQMSAESIKTACITQTELFYGNSVKKYDFDFFNIECFDR